MSIFSKLLSTHIKNKNIRTFSLAQYCEIDRSNMYKLINGKRNPSSEEMVNRISEYMKLTNSEHREFMEAYKISLIGNDVYYRRKSVQEFMSHFIEPKNFQPYKSFFAPDFHHLSEQKPIFVSDKRELRQIIQMIITLASKEDGCIDLLLQPSNTYIMEALYYIGNREKNLKIEHIFGLSNVDDIGENKKDYNLTNLQNIIPFYYLDYCQYMSYYYYDDILAHDNIFNLFKSMILTSGYVLVFSEKLENGILFTQKDIVANFYEVFKKLKNEASPIVKKINSIFEQLKYFEELEPGRIKGYEFQQQPCFVPLLPLTFPEKYLIREIPDRKQFVDEVLRYIKKESELYKSGPTFFCFTQEGVEDFLRTGRFYELPEEVYTPIEYEDRVLLVRNLMIACKKYNYIMLRPESVIAKSNLSIYATVRKGYILFKTVQKRLVCLSLEEHGILYAFYDYLSSLDESNFYTTEETIGILKNLLKKVHEYN